MPRDNKTSLIQKIAKQASTTFRGVEPSANSDNKVVEDKLHELISLVTAVRASDVKIAPRKTKSSSGAAGLQSPPATYMHICETEVFSMGVFLLRTGASIPLHDHPGMNGMLKDIVPDIVWFALNSETRLSPGNSSDLGTWLLLTLYPVPVGAVLYGKVNVRCFDKLEQNLAVATVPPVFDPPVPPLQMTSVWRAVLRSVVEYSENSGPCLLTPVRDNLHQIYAVDGPAAFLDILAPPYNSDDGRDCHYYKVLQSALEDETDAKGNQEQQGEKEKEEEVWLLEIPQPEDFWCGGESYPGPAVSV